MCFRPAWQKKILKNSYASPGIALCLHVCMVMCGWVFVWWFDCVKIGLFVKKLFLLLHPLISDMKLALLYSYRYRLKERHRRKRWESERNFSSIVLLTVFLLPAFLSVFLKSPWSVKAVTWPAPAKIQEANFKIMTPPPPVTKLCVCVCGGGGGGGVCKPSCIFQWLVVYTHMVTFFLILQNCEGLWLD